jgi:tRNA(adenine34) deaminase
VKPKLSKFDRECLQKAIKMAAETFENGANYPVGAVLAINNTIVDVAGNNVFKRQSKIYHAENYLVIRNGKKLLKANTSGQSSTLYTTLEPCIQCLGACVTNCINRIIYIQKDPNGGACDIKHDKIGLHYRNFWPLIIHAPVSNMPKNLIISFFKAEIAKGHTEWPMKMLELFKKH